MTRLGLLCALACVVVVASEHHSEKAMHHVAKSGHHNKAFRHGERAAEGKIHASTTAGVPQITVLTRRILGKTTVVFSQEQAEYLKTLIAMIPVDGEGAIDWTQIFPPIPAPTCTGAQLKVVTSMIDLHIEQKKQLPKITNKELENNLSGAPLLAGDDTANLLQQRDDVLKQIDVIIQMTDPDADFKSFMQCLGWLDLDPTLFDMKGVPGWAQDLVSMHPIVDKLESSECDLLVANLNDLSSYRVALNEEGRDLAARAPMPKSGIAYAADEKKRRRELVCREKFIKTYFKTPAGDWLQKDQLIPAVGAAYLPENFTLGGLYRRPAMVFDPVALNNMDRAADVRKIMSTLEKDGRLEISLVDGMKGPLMSPIMKEFKYVLVPLPG